MKFDEYVLIGRVSWTQELMADYICSHDDDE